MMTIENLIQFLGWCIAINGSILILSTVSILLFKKTFSSIHAKLFSLNQEALSRAYFNYLANYKILVIVFNITPYIALRIINS